MKNILILSLAAVLCGGFALAEDEHAMHHHHDMAAADSSKPATLQGEIVDLGCYLVHGGQGSKHADCALTCIKSGGPMGLLVGDSLFVLVKSHEKSQEKAYEALKEKAGEKVRVMGTLAKKGGLQALIVMESAAATK